MGGKRYYGTDAPMTAGPHPDQFADMPAEITRLTEALNKIAHPLASATLGDLVEIARQALQNQPSGNPGELPEPDWIPWAGGPDEVAPDTVLQFLKDGQGQITHYRPVKP